MELAQRLQSVARKVTYMNEYTVCLEVIVEM
jgi:hypothetical protein